MSAVKNLISELGPKALSFFWKTGFKKALTIGMGLATSLIASTAVTDLLIPYFLSKIDPEYQHENSLLLELFAPVAGLVIFFICLFCLFLVDLSLPASIRSDLVFAAIKQWNVDADSHPNPIFGISSKQLLEFAERLTICLGDDNET